MVRGAGTRQYGSLDARSGSSGRSGRLSFMPGTPQPQPTHTNMLGNLLDDEEDYVIIDGPSPFGSTHASMCAQRPRLLSTCVTRWTWLR